MQECRKHASCSWRPQSLMKESDKQIINMHAVDFIEPDSLVWLSLPWEGAGEGPGEAIGYYVNTALPTTSREQMSTPLSILSGFCCCSAKYWAKGVSLLRRKLHCQDHSAPTFIMRPLLLLLPAMLLSFSWTTGGEQRFCSQKTLKWVTPTHELN